MSSSEMKAVAFTGLQQGYMNADAFVSKQVSLQLLKRLEVDDTHAAQVGKRPLYTYIKRGVDIVISACVLALLCPLFVSVAVGLAIRHRGRVFAYTSKTGLHCRPFNEYTFDTKQRLVRKMPLLVNVLKGDLSLIGPRAASPGEMCAECRRLPQARRRNTIRPGLICDWWVRRHASLDYVREILLDCGYVESPSFRKDVSIVLRALPGLITAFIWGDEPSEYASRISILDVRIDNVSMQCAIDRVMQMFDRHSTSQVCFINPHYINESFRVPQYKAVLDNAELIFADGFGTRLAGKILHRPVRQNLCGTDLFPRLCTALSDSGKSVYLLGAAPGAAEQVAKWVGQHYPNIVVKGWHHGFFTPEEEPGMVREIAASGADMLIASMGVPLQELWLHDHLEAINVKVAMGFGGLFDYYAGRVPRAPQWVREIGMEWVYRLLQEPRRMWRRYLIGNGLFLARVFHERLRPQEWKGLPAED